jgi:hypothetical protein
MGDIKRFLYDVVGYRLLNSFLKKESGLESKIAGTLLDTCHFGASLKPNFPKILSFGEFISTYPDYQVDEKSKFPYVIDSKYFFAKQEGIIPFILNFKSKFFPEAKTEFKNLIDDSDSRFSHKISDSNLYFCVDGYKQQPTRTTSFFDADSDDVININSLVASYSEKVLGHSNKSGAVKKTRIRKKDAVESFDPSNPVPYSMQGSYKEGMTINHSTFGIGHVVKSRYERIEVKFGKEVKVLVQNWK